MSEQKMPVPPVEDAWKKMKEALDKQLPVQPDLAARPDVTRYLSVGKSIAGLSAIIIVSLSLWLTFHHAKTPKPVRPTGSRIATDQPIAKLNQPIAQPRSQTSGTQTSDTQTTGSQASETQTAGSEASGSLILRESALDKQSSENKASGNLTPQGTTLDKQRSNNQPSDTRTSASPFTAGANLPNMRRRNHTDMYRPYHSNMRRLYQPHMPGSNQLNTHRPNQQNTQRPNHPAATGADLATRTAFNHTNNRRSARSSGGHPGDDGHSTPITSHTQQRDQHLHVTLHPTPTKPTIGLSYRRLADSLLKKLASKNEKPEKPAPKQPKPKPQSANIFTAGLQLSLALPVNGQQSSGNSRLFSDHIPAPYFRWYAGNRFYLEASIQINQPQYVRSQLLDSASDSIHTAPYQGYLEVNRYTLKKLYYSNIPVMVHYRLFHDLYIGTGIQYSLRWGGVAADEKLIRPSNGLGIDSIVSNTTTGLKGTNAWSKVRSADLRLLFGLSYYWRRFTLSAQYQQGLAPYLQDNSGHDHAASIRIGLQYDIWEKKRK